MADISETELNRRTLENTFNTGGFTGTLEQFAQDAVATQNRNMGAPGLGGGREINLDVSLGGMMNQQEFARKNATNGGIGGSSGGDSGAGGGAFDPNAGKTGAYLPDGRFVESGFDQYGNPNGSGVSSSSSATNYFNTLNGQLNSLQGPDFIEPNSDAQLQLIKTQREQIKSDLDAALASIQSDFNRRRQGQVQTNREITGGTKAFLGRAGGLTSASGRSQVASTVRAGQEALDNLTRLEQDTMQTARSAASAQDIQLLQKSIDEIDSIRQEKNQLRQNIFQNTIASGEFNLAQQEAQRAQAADQFEFLSQFSSDQVATMDPNRLSQLESQLGYPEGTFDAFYQAKDAVNEAASEQDRLDRALQVFDLALKMPAGFKFSLPLGADGESVEIMGMDAGDFKVFQSTDNAGNITYTSVNPNDGSLVGSFTQAGAGQSKTSGGGGGGGGSTSTVSSGVFSGLQQWIGLLGQDILVDELGSPLLDPDTGAPIIAGPDSAPENRMTVDAGILNQVGGIYATQSGNIDDLDFINKTLGGVNSGSEIKTIDDGSNNYIQVDKYGNIIAGGNISAEAAKFAPPGSTESEGSDGFWGSLWDGAKGFVSEFNK